jgi:N4-(beta-N-acetylglucosaminyl)-L-asparaginase
MYQSLGPSKFSLVEFFNRQSLLVRSLFLLSAGVAVSGTIAGIVYGVYRVENTPSSPVNVNVVVNTWFAESAQSAFDFVSQGYSALDAVEVGCTTCEDLRCDGTVGWGGSPDTTGETTLDAIIMDGNTKATGAVSGLRRIRHAISTARKVMQYTQHTLLVGESATNFSISVGFPEQDLHSNNSIAIYDSWIQNSCQPNYYANMENVNTTCPPYIPIPTPSYTPMPQKPIESKKSDFMKGNQHMKPSGIKGIRGMHDTVGMCVIDSQGNIATGGSSNGATHKVAGRASDISLPGAGAYVDKDGGCAAATGDGDITSRFLPAYQAVEFMRNGVPPQQACEQAVRRIMMYYGQNFHIGLVCLDKFGNIGAASQGWVFTYAFASANTNGTAQLVQVQPLPL